MLKRLRKNHPLLYCIGAEAVFLGACSFHRILW